jgi:hypothetical protein
MTNLTADQRFPTPWRVAHRNAPIADTGDYDCLTLILAANDEEVAEAWNPGDERVEAFERIVRTVNAAETAAPHAYFEEWYCGIYARRPDAFQGSKAALRSAWEAGAASVCRSAAADGEGAGVKSESHPTG